MELSDQAPQDWIGFPFAEQIILGIACIIFLFLGRLFTRWPKVEPWLVATAFAGLAPFVFLALWVTTNGVFDRYGSPNRIYFTLFAPPLLWWVLRTKTSLLGNRSVNSTGQSIQVPLMFLLPVMAILLAQEFRVSHLGPGAPVLIASCQLIVIGLWYVVSLRWPAQGAASGAPKEAAAVSGESSDVASSRTLARGPAVSDALKNVPVMPSPHPVAAAQPVHSVKHDNIFVSYRRQDSADVTGRIYDRLIQRFGKEQIFKDVDSIPLGVDFREHLGGVVGKCDVLLAVIGNEWLAGDTAGHRRIDDAKDFVRIEIEAALERKIPVIPVLVRGASVPTEQELPASLVLLSYRNGIAVRSDPDFHHDMDRLIAGLEAHLAGSK
jgi:TIR domain